MIRLRSGSPIMSTRPPFYLKIADEIEAKIQSGEYRPGHKLPSTAELAELYHVGRATAGRAVRELHERDLVYGQQGLGVFVA
jgi:DNA-binding GntR family transcriptional regulator